VDANRGSTARSSTTGSVTCSAACSSVDSASPSDAAATSDGSVSDCWASDCSASGCSASVCAGAFDSSLVASPRLSSLDGPLPFGFSSLMSILRVANRVRCVGRARALVDANRAKAARLENAHELEANHLEQREKRDDDAAAIADIGEQIFETA